MVELAAILPAAGRATRLGPIPCSKEIMPLGFQLRNTAEGEQWEPVTAIETHLQGLKLAGVTRCAIVISELKADIPRYLGSGQRYHLSLAYLYQQELRGMPYALDLAASWIGNATTAFSMPDTLITPHDTLARLVQYHYDHPAELTLGLFPTMTPHKFGMVALDGQGAVVNFVDKPAQTELTWMWGLAVWSPGFTHFLSRFLTQQRTNDGEVVLSDVFLAALVHGLTVQGLMLDEAHYHDIGTPEDFQAVVADLANIPSESHRSNSPTGITRKY